MTSVLPRGCQATRVSLAVDRNKTTNHSCTIPSSQFLLPPDRNEKLMGRGADFKAIILWYCTLNFGIIPLLWNWDKVLAGCNFLWSLDWLKLMPHSISTITHMMCMDGRLFSLGRPKALLATRYPFGTLYSILVVLYLCHHVKFSNLFWNHCYFAKLIL